VIVPIIFALQQALAPSPTTPPSGDTTGYWQQHIAYRITARLDERAQTAHAAGELRYVNASPDTLREMYFHQYLNAFRPGSRWSAVDEREGRVRFQHLREPDYAYERFTSTPTFDGVAVAPVYPFTPDSTVVRFTLPRPLAPGDSMRVRFEWDARPSATVYRRQGRRGREYDFAQWYPKVAVYDRLGWEANPLTPAGELYGEFGTYDVTLILPDDQIVGASGVPVSGDPGWKRALTWGELHLGADAYGPVGAPETMSDGGAGASDALPAGFRRVRFLAKDVHHFAWTVSPAFRYEGALYRGKIPVHVLYRPQVAALWGNGKAVDMHIRALEWLEKIYGPYAYPQVTGTQRLDGGATEFPMMVMYGGMSPGLVLHEVGHIYSYGFLANNEWRSGWMDEGLTDYQAAWAQNLTRPERARGEAPKLGTPPTGYRRHAVQPDVLDAGALEQYQLDLLGRAQPIGLPAYDFSDFGIYNQMVYGRASDMYGALRDAIGDSAFIAFLHDYYARWKFKHVDEHAMRGSAERASGQDLGWFFAQWVHRTGLIDYGLRDVRITRDGDAWVTRARIQRVGEYRHPMAVGALTSRGWVTARGSALEDDQWVEIRTSERPTDVKLDPLHLTEDYNRLNDAISGTPGATRTVFDWPFLKQEDGNREIAAVAPLAWYTDPGGFTPALRLRTNYQGWLNRWELGIAVPVRSPAEDLTGRGRLQGWITTENPMLPFASRPLIGLRAGLWALDGVAKVGLSKTWDASPFYYANGPTRTWTLGLSSTLPYDAAWIDGRRWDYASVLDAQGEYRWRGRNPTGLRARATVIGGLVADRVGPRDSRGFERAEVEGSKVAYFGARRQHGAMLRLFGGVSDNAPAQRSIGLSALDPTETFGNDLLRGRGAPLARSDVHFVALGGAGVRGYSPLVRMRNVAAANAQVVTALNTPRPRSLMPRVWLSGFVDGAWGSVNEPGSTARLFADAGVGLSLRGVIFDQPLTARVDVPVWVRKAPGGGDRLHWVVSLNDLW
jgi:hypothetical protein